MKDRANAAVNIQLLEVADEPYTVTDTYEASFYQRVTFKMLDKEKRRRMTTCAVYFAILLLGILIGLIPYLLHYVKESKADREVLREFIKKNVTRYHVQLADLEAKVNKLMKDQSPSSMAITSRTTKTILHKKASIIGNGTINLMCKGDIKIVSVKLNDIAAYPNDITKFNNFCKDNRTAKKNSNSCHVSMFTVMGYTLGSNEFTEIDYSCEETV